MERTAHNRLWVVSVACVLVHLELVLRFQEAHSNQAGLVVLALALFLLENQVIKVYSETSNRQIISGERLQILKTKS